VQMSNGRASIRKKRSERRSIHGRQVITGLKQILGTNQANGSLKILLANRKIVPRFSQNANKFIKLKQNCPPEPSKQWH
jgi:hypothetical protein